jgi:hypothetical protein
VPYADVRIAEYSGLDALNPFDAASSNSGTGNIVTSGSVTTTSASELFVGGGMTSGAFNGSSAGLHHSHHYPDRR